MPRPLLRALFWSALMGTAVLSLLPVTTLPPITFSVWDKAQHAIAFFVLGGLARAAYAVRSRVLVAAMLLYGAAIELAQGATGFRYADWRDWVADAVGLIAAIAGVHLWRNRNAQRRADTRMAPERSTTASDPSNTSPYNAL